MKRGIIGIVLATVAAYGFGAPQPVTLSPEKWRFTPLSTARFEAKQIVCPQTSMVFFAEYEGLPLSSNVEVRARFLPQATRRNGYTTAAVAIQLNDQNFWHVGLVEAPPDQNSRRYCELCEMKDGIWLSQNSLRCELAEGDGAWSFGEPVTLSLKLTEKGIEGTVCNSAGKQIFRKRYAFTARAVRYGRIALRANGIQGVYDAVAGEVTGPAVTEPETPPTFPPYAIAPNAPGITGQATGFFHVEQKPDGRWWTIDPNGKGIVVLGIDHVTYYGHNCEKLGTSLYFQHNKKTYSEEAWAKETLGRLKTWGFNMLGAGNSRILRHRGLIHAENLSIGSTLASQDDELNIEPHERRPCSAFPNVFSPKFRQYAEYTARNRCRPNRNDQWVFGYFIDNELAWWGRSHGDKGKREGIFDSVLKKASGHSAKAALRDFLKERAGGDIAAFNRVWGTKLTDFNGILALTSLPSTTEEQSQTKHDFLKLVADRYFSITSEAIRRHDPNHMVLGARFAGTGGADPAVWEIAGKYCDLVTFNCYPMADLDRNVMYTHLGKTGERIDEHFTRYYGYAKRPILITEWSFPALDSGLPCTHGAGQRFYTQRERTQATSLFARTMLSLPFLLGYDYFMWVDQPPLGISTPFPENSNYGLVTEEGKVWPEITDMFTRLHKDIAAYRFRPVPEARAVPDRTTRNLPALLSAYWPKERAYTHPSSFRKNPDGSFVLENDKLKLTGKIGRDQVVHVGDAATFNGLIQTMKEGKNLWIDAKEIVAVEGGVFPESTVGIAYADVTFRSQYAGLPFEITQRLYLPPSNPAWFVAECRSVKNLGTKPLPLIRTFFRLWPAFQVAKGEEIEVPPNLWRAWKNGCWVEEGDAPRFAGMCIPFRENGYVRFWDDSSRHPDVSFELPPDTALLPGETGQMPDLFFAFGTVGSGNRENWLKAIEQLKGTKK
ncbi:MAG: hypothetical protein IJR99_00270 [Kiritimatiellae bacterium]|nr:hypothetical protein [Kiritimatiellia bacterium]